MKYGAHCYLFTPRWADDQLGVLEQCVRLGLDFFELSTGDDVDYTWAETRREAERLGLELTISPGGEWPLACDLSSDDPDERKLGLAWHQRVVEEAVEVGATAYAGSLYAHTGVVKRRRPPADEYSRTAEGLHELAEFGARKGVTIVLEPMSHFRTHLVNTPQQVTRLIELADHDNLRVSFDTYHLVTEVTDYGEALLAVEDRLWGIHACESNRGVPGRGLVPWDTIFETLAAMNFEGYMMLEAYNSSIGDFAYERGMFHNVCPDPAAFVQEGVGFLKEGMTRVGA